jgi:septation ring formation regulator EzrA
VPRLCEFYLGICLTTEKKARENLSEGRKNLSQVKKNLSQSTVYILPKQYTYIYIHTHTHTHTRNGKDIQKLKFHSRKN